MRGRYFEEFAVGETLVTGRRTIDGGDVSRFAGLTGDFNPLHIDAEFAKTTPFGEPVAHGILTLAVSNGPESRRLVRGHDARAARARPFEVHGAREIRRHGPYRNDGD